VHRLLSLENSLQSFAEIRAGADLELKDKKKVSQDDIFELLLETSKKKRASRRAELLQSLNAKEFFDEGSITINERTCQGLECELCIKVCPTRALYWRNGTVGIIEDLCIYCGACVLNCIVDDCIVVIRKRDGKTETFRRPDEVVRLFGSISSKRRCSRVRSIFPDSEAYLKRYHGTGRSE
jgi:NAD-dependent dihydropyrimidine dehydrogenase PreA subunit